MPVRLCAARQAAHGALQPSTGHVWISDQYLQETLGSFTACISGCKRHGSNVPGPLEARRRLAKRQLGHLAAVGQAGGPPVDPALLTFGWFGNTRGTSAEQDITWLPPGATGAIRIGKHSYPKLPSWLDVKHPPSDTSNLDLEQILGPQPQLNEITVAQYKLRLGRTNNLEDIRTLNEELGNAVLDAERCSIAAFKHLTARYVMIRNARGAQDAVVRCHRNELFHFLGDPLLDRSKLRNLHAFASMLTTERASTDDVSFVLRQLNAVYSSFGSSDVTPDLLKVLIRLSERLEGCDIMTKISHKIWYASKEQPRRAEIGKLLFCYISKSPPGPETTDLAIDILRTLRPVIDYAYPLAIDVQDKKASWRRSIGAFARNLLSQDQAQQEKKLSLEQPLDSEKSPTLSFVLRVLPPEYTGTFGAAVTLTLVEDLGITPESHVALDRLRTWTQTLRMVTNRPWTLALPKATIDSMYGRIASVLQPSVASFVFEPLNGLQISETLLQHWLSGERAAYAPLRADLASDRSHHAADTLRKSWHKSRDNLERLASRWLNPSQIALVALVDASKLHELDWEMLLDDLLGLLQTLDRKQDFVKVAEGWKRLQKGSSFTVQHRSRFSQFINQCGEHDALRALKVFGLDKRNFLSQHPDLIERLSQSPLVESKDILPLLLRHDRHVDVPVIGRKHTAGCKLSTERIELVQALALQLAMNERFTLREASLGVHFCWKYLKSNQAPLDKRMAEAAIVAGILRPFAAGQWGQWVPTKQLKWVAKVVEEICGQEAVKELDRMAFDLRPKRSYDMLRRELRAALVLDRNQRWLENPPRH